MNLGVNTEGSNSRRQGPVLTPAVAFRLIYADCRSPGKGGKKTPGLRDRVIVGLQEYFGAIRPVSKHSFEETGRLKKVATAPLGASCPNDNSDFRNKSIDPLQLYQEKKLSFNYHPYTHEISSINIYPLRRTDIPILDSQGFRMALSFRKVLEFNFDEFNKKTQELLKEVSRSEVESKHLGLLS